LARIRLGGVSGRAGCRHLTCLECSELQCREEAGAPSVPAGLITGLTSGDDGGGLSGEISPTLAHLPGANEHARAGPGRAIPVNVELGDVAVARFRGGQAAKNGKVLGEADARAARAVPRTRMSVAGAVGTLSLRSTAPPVLVTTRSPTGLASNLGRSVG